ncbi:hypothetical protein CYV19_18140 [Natronobacterium gregoryi SP2]|uniref:Uncharacterized protein n=1 Tax=Natronobacterium gregoryi (strain ATCC 43098 / DSM 3393 / CCM 3738 / CIP 104747 / IAM 13177 / JCM 8860 / NBRC 102187 / NCIMB 2189 / SP2) TaxID=797304 RepID=A0A2J4JAC3_NATGS|nr:hypothetical protein CYV19_18140 [Natronobacterium gregoryi SP2]
MDVDGERVSLDVPAVDLHVSLLVGISHGHRVDDGRTKAGGLLDGERDDLRLRVVVPIGDRLHFRSVGTAIRRSLDCVTASEGGWQGRKERSAIHSAAISR